MADSSVNLPAGFGGLTRFNEEYDTLFPLKPGSIIIFVALIIAFRVFLGFWY